MDAADKEELFANLAKLHTTELGTGRIRKNLSLDAANDVESWCREQIRNPAAEVRKNGKNFYVRVGDCEITVHARSCTIITAHRI
ncbi:MAG: DUF3781 domain-containing protein [Methanocalculaceae archaeon]|jgi:hypothetical protein|nr:DUF3781 domain-containing protein [Methanocalculaceae archaeon]